METGMRTLTPDLAERKRILKDICRNHPQWKIRIALATVLFIAAVGVLGGTIGLLIRPVSYTHLTLPTNRMV